MDKVTYCLDADPRPTCVLHLASPHGPHINYKNKALQEQSHLVHDLLDSSASTGLQAWALDGTYSGTVTVSGTASLHAYTIENTWRVIQWLLPEKPSGHEQNEKNPPCEQTKPLVKALNSLSLDRKLEDALADRDDVTGKLSNLRQMMEMVDVGMFEYNKEGVLLYGNDAFHSLAGVPKGNQKPMEWANWVFEEDKPWLTNVWISLTEGGSSTFEMRWLGPNPDENPEGQWVLAACVSTTDGAGNVLVSGCITDISAQKRSHADAAKRAEALERAQASEMRFAGFIKHSNSAFFNFGMDRKVSTRPSSGRNLMGMLMLHRCDTAIPNGSKSAVILLCTLKRSNGTCSWTPEMSKSWLMLGRQSSAPSNLLNFNSSLTGSGAMDMVTTCVLRSSLLLTPSWVRMGQLYRFRVL